MTLIDVICDTCQSQFKKAKGEYNRSVKLGRKFYCSLKCYGKNGIENIPKSKRHRPENLKAGGWQLSELSPFKQLFNSAKYHSRSRKTVKKEFSITLAQVKDQWDSQNGICPITGWVMKIPTSTCHLSSLPKTPDRASLDRIDSTIGYIPGNIRFIALIAQYAKNEWDDSDLLEFCNSVVKHHNDDNIQEIQELWRL